MRNAFRHCRRVRVVPHAQMTPAGYSEQVSTRVERQRQRMMLQSCYMQNLSASNIPYTDFAGAVNVCKAAGSQYAARVWMKFDSPWGAGVPSQNLRKRGERQVQSGCAWWQRQHTCISFPSGKVNTFTVWSPCVDAKVRPSAANAIAIVERAPGGMSKKRRPCRPGCTQRPSAHCEIAIRVARGFNPSERYPRFLTMFLLRDLAKRTGAAGHPEGGRHGAS